MKLTRFLLAAGLLVGTAVIHGQADASPVCGGNQSVKTAPYECHDSKTIDGTLVTADLKVTDTTVTVVYTLDAPRPATTPIRLRSHKGISSTGSQPNQATGSIPAGSTTGTLSVTLRCGQIDVKFWHITPGDQTGRVTAPFVTNENNCVETPETTTTTPATTTTTPSTTTTTRGTVPPGAPRLPPTGKEINPIAGFGIALLLVGGAALLVISPKLQATVVRKFGRN